MTPRKEPDAEPLIARDATYYRAPETLRTRIRAAVRAEARERARPMMWRWGGLAAAFATVALVSWNVALLQGGPSDEDRLLAEVSTAHVRSLMAENHPNDVASTDQHTVKPWFEGKLDFAPAVTDLADAGYALLGGRLDYLDSRPVAALTYRHRLHVVNLFEWPSARGADAPPRIFSRNGYAIAHWRRGGLQYWAISDIASADLLEFAKRLS